MSKHTLVCPPPSTGSITCDLDQLAICRLINGQSHAECISVPPAIRRASRAALEAWCIDEITGMGMYPVPPAHLHQRILQSGQYNVPSLGISVTFRMPRFTASGRTDDSSSSSGGGGGGGIRPQRPEPPEQQQVIEHQ
ncbi:hypothetical protein D9M69_420860 [compost metagenome]